MKNSVAPGPLTNRSAMWGDWSSNAHESRHDACSRRQLVNSGVTGKVKGRDLALRNTSTALPC
ncbi:hypothetical protein [Pseudarthrobacter sp. DSP2-3-2b1]|uniref:hypothetical protein n=1 Tax=Pseudarthrobacter sp. DSP2-3-2b1 TaxID=2804661 RepID=UPI003CEA485E